MPPDAMECRQQALACVRLAQTSNSPAEGLRYANLAWLMLAGELQDLEAQLKSEPKKRKTRLAPDLRRGFC